MNLVYVLVPFFKTDSHLDIETKSMQLLGVHDDNVINVHDISANQYAIEIKQFDLHFMEINSLLQQHNQTKRRIQIYQNLLRDYQLPASSVQQNLLQSQDGMLKKMKKYKQLKEQNKKLKKLLQVQLQNTEKVRQQTQKTMKVLRQQFDALVVEISRKQKSSSQLPYECHSNPPQLDARDYQKKEKHSQSGGGKHISSIR